MADSTYLAADVGRVPAGRLRSLRKAHPPCVWDIYQGPDSSEGIHDVIDAAHAILDRPAGIH